MDSETFHKGLHNLNQLSWLVSEATSILLLSKPPSCGPKSDDWTKYWNLSVSSISWNSHISSSKLLLWSKYLHSKHTFVNSKILCIYLAISLLISDLYPYRSPYLNIDKIAKPSTVFDLILAFMLIPVNPFWCLEYLKNYMKPEVALVDSCIKLFRSDFRCASIYKTLHCSRCDRLEKTASCCLSRDHDEKIENLHEKRKRRFAIWYIY